MGFLGGCAATFSAGIIYGIHRSLKKEKTTLAKNASGAFYAAKALALGTLLCFGTFSLIFSAFIMTTGISSVKEFTEEARKALRFADVTYTQREYSAEQKAEDEEVERQIDLFFQEFYKPKEQRTGTLTTFMDVMKATDELAASQAAVHEKPKRRSPILDLFTLEEGQEARPSPVFDWVKNIGDFLSGKSEPPADTVASSESTNTDKPARRESPIMQLFKKKEPVDSSIEKQERPTVPTSDNSSPVAVPADVIAAVPEASAAAPVLAADTTAVSTQPQATYYSYFVTQLFGSQVAPSAVPTSNSNIKE